MKIYSTKKIHNKCFNCKMSKVTHEVKTSLDDPITLGFCAGCFINNFKPSGKILFKRINSSKDWFTVYFEHKYKISFPDLALIHKFTQEDIKNFISE